MTKILLVLALVSFSTSSAESASNLKRDAQRLISCMKALDADCVGAVTYTKFMEDMGAPRAELIGGAKQLYANLKSIGARYTQLDLGDPLREFSGDGRQYAFIPYKQVMEVPGQGSMRQESFFIGVSLDKGVNWQFVDGARATAENIRAIIPSYDGQPLPK